MGQEESFFSVSSPYLSMGMHCGGSGPITPIPTKPVPRPLGSSSLFSSPLHSLLYRHPYLAAGGWTTTVDARFNFMSTCYKKSILGPLGCPLMTSRPGEWSRFLWRQWNVKKRGGEIIQNNYTPFSDDPFFPFFIKNFIQLQVPNFQLSSPKLLNKDSY